MSATVVSGCIVTTTAVNFGVYDPLADGDAQAQGAVTLTCAGGVTPTVSLGNGQFSNQANTTEQDGDVSPAEISSGVAITRTMHNAGTWLGYDLFADTGMATVWNTTNTISPGALGAAQPVVLPVYGAIPAKQTQTLRGGAYADTVVVTVNF